MPHNRPVVNKKHICNSAEPMERFVFINTNRLVRQITARRNNRRTKFL